MPQSHSIIFTPLGHDKKIVIFWSPCGSFKKLVKKYTPGRVSGLHFKLSFDTLYEVLERCSIYQKVCHHLVYNV